MACGIGSRGSLPLPRPACTLTLRCGNHPAAGRGPLAVPELKEEGLVRLPNTTLRIRQLDLKDVCDITDAVLKVGCRAHQCRLGHVGGLWVV